MLKNGWQKFGKKAKTSLSRSSDDSPVTPASDCAPADEDELGALVAGGEAALAASDVRAED